MIGAEGFEPPTLGSEGWIRICLKYLLFKGLRRR
jgi:hypothetical protein